MRECDCGETERENVPATGHQWDDGKVTKQPTEATAGEKTYTCQSCKATKREAVAALGSAAPTESSVSTDLGNAFNSAVEVGNMQDAESSSVAENLQEPVSSPESSISDTDSTQVEEQSDNHGALILIIVLIIAAVVLIGIGVAVVCIVLVIKKSKKA